MRYYLLALLALSACGQAPQDPRALEYLDRFESTYELSISHIEVVFVKDHVEGRNNLIAYCGYNRMVIVEPWWDILDDLQREVTIFHELGHCVFDLDHDDAQYEDGCSKSIMSTYMDSGWCLTKYRDQLISNLRSKL